MRSTRRVGIWTVVALLATWVCAADGAPRVAPILTDVETDFGTYRPQLVTVDPSLVAAQIPQDLSGVENLAAFGLGDPEREALRGHGFFLADSGRRQIYEQYKDAKERGVPIFVTTDGLLHTLHVVYDYALRVMEVRRFSDDLKVLTEAVQSRMQSELDAASDPVVRDVLRKNVAYFSVALSLLDSEAKILESV